MRLSLCRGWASCARGTRQRLSVRSQPKHGLHWGHVWVTVQPCNFYATPVSNRVVIAGDAGEATYRDMGWGPLRSSILGTLCRPPGCPWDSFCRNHRTEGGLWPCGFPLQFPLVPSGVMIRKENVPLVMEKAVFVGRGSCSPQEELSH